MSKGVDRPFEEASLTEGHECAHHRFLADAMLIRLARWLRVLGFDTRCLPRAADKELVAIADRERRWLLTRDRALIRELKPEKSLLVTSHRPLDQLSEVVRACRLAAPPALFRRCLICNSILREATTDEILAGVPPQARRYADEVLHCPGCGRQYWPGSHTKRMKNALREVFPEWFDG